MAQNYTTLDDVRKSYMSPWDDSWDEWVTDQIPVISAMLRQEFKKYSRNLDADILSGKVEEILLKSVANNMINRMISSMDTGMGGSGVDYSNLSATAGPYSFAMTAAGSTGSFYVKRDERRMLGLPAIATGTIETRYFRESDYVS